MFGFNSCLRYRRTPNLWSLTGALLAYFEKFPPRKFLFQPLQLIIFMNFPNPPPVFRDQRVICPPSIPLLILLLPPSVKHGHCELFCSFSKSMGCRNPNSLLILRNMRVLPSALPPLCPTETLGICHFKIYLLQSQER